MILLTGATGFVGAQLLNKLLSQGHKVVCLVRDPTKMDPRENLEIIKADLGNLDILADINDFEKLLKVETIVHLAALYDLTSKHSECYLANVIATMNLAVLSRKLPNFKYFIHTSTVAISGNKNGDITTTTYEFNQAFANSYASTKAQAEGYIRRAIDGKKLCILRPGIIIGDSQDMSKFKADGPYLAVKYFSQKLTEYPFLKKLPLLYLPVNVNSTLPLITVDIVVDCLFIAIQEQILGCHHLVMSTAPRVIDFSQDLLSYLGSKSVVKALNISPKLISLSKRVPLGNFPTELLDYMAIEPIYEKTKNSSLLTLLDQVSWSELKSEFFRQAINK